MFFNMVRYVFILGRNPELSLKELKCYFKRSDFDLSESDFVIREGAVLVDLDKSLDADAIDFLGGVLSIGVVFCKIKDIDKKEIYMGEKNNFNYAIWDFSSGEAEDVRDYLKSRFRKEKLKASEKKLRFDLDLQSSGSNEFSEGKKEKGMKLSSKVDEEYFVFGDYFGKIIQKCDYKKIEESDMNKPVRRESLSISPRLVKIMINLSEIKEGEILLDAFCGVGVVLSEGLSQNLKVVGIDRDAKAIDGAKENLEWFKFLKENYRLINDDSSRVEIYGGFDVLVSEPDFGETLKKIPTLDKAKEMLKRYEKIMTAVFSNVKKYLHEGKKGRFVFTSPYIRIGKKRVGVDLEVLAKKVGMNLVEGFPIAEFREGQIVGRQVVVFEKI